MLSPRTTRRVAILIFLAGMAPWSCSYFFPPDAPTVPAEFLEAYPGALHLTTFGCSGERSVPRLKESARGALTDLIRGRVGSAFGDLNEVLLKLGLPARYAQWPLYSGADASIPYEHLVKTDLDTHWQDEFEGSCLLASVERKKASWILERDYERCRKQFEFSSAAVLEKSGEMENLGSAWRMARGAFGEMAFTHFHLRLIGQQNELRGQEWQALEGRYVQLVFAIEEMLARAPLLVVVGGEVPAATRVIAGKAAQVALESLGVRLHRGEADPAAFALRLELSFECRDSSGMECCVDLSGQLFSPGRAEPLAECDLSPADPCASAGASKHKTMDTLAARISSGHELAEKLAACVGMLLPVD